MEDEYTTATFSQRKYAQGSGNLADLLGAKGKAKALIQNLQRQEMGKAGQAKEELKQILSSKFKTILTFTPAQIEKIVGNMSLLSNFEHMNILTLAAVIIFLNISGALKQKTVGLNVKYFNGKNAPFKTVYTQLKKEMEPLYGPIDDSKEFGFKETFVRYFLIMFKKFPKDLPTRI